MKQNMFYGADRIIFERAKELRNKLTGAEILLWERFLKEKPEGYKFRRQHPLGLYIADFYCHKLKLVIEVDGNIHQRTDIARKDVERQKDIETNGIVVLRFTNEEIEKRLDTVIIRVKEFINNSSRSQNTDKRS